MKAKWKHARQQTSRCGRLWSTPCRMYPAKYSCHAMLALLLAPAFLTLWSCYVLTLVPPCSYFASPFAFVWFFLTLVLLFVLILSRLDLLLSLLQFCCHPTLTERLQNQNRSATKSELALAPEFFKIRRSSPTTQFSKSTNKDTNKETTDSTGFRATATLLPHLEKKRRRSHPRS